MDRTRGVFSPVEVLSGGELKEHKWERLRGVLKKAAQGSQEFAARLERAGMDVDGIGSFDDFAAIAPLRKKEIIALQAEHGLEWMLRKEIGELRRVYQSPGPIFDPEGTGRNYWGWAEGFFAAGFRPRDVVQMTFSYHLTPAGLMLEEPLREIGCCVIPAGPGNTAVQMELMTSLPVTGFVGMASYLQTIGVKARKAGLDPRKDFQLEVAFVAAERLTESLRNDVQDMFGMLVRQGYGTADVGCIAYECPELGGMHVAPRCFVEICDPATGTPLPAGETGEVVVTPFTDAYPLIRLATGDLSFLVDEECACGRTAPRLGGIVGRVDDTIKVKGQFLYASQAASVMQEFPQVSGWQVVVANPGGRDTVTLRVAVKGGVDEKALAQRFQECLKLRPLLAVLSPEESIPEDAANMVDERTFD